MTFLRTFIQAFLRHFQSLFDAGYQSDISNIPEPSTAKYAEYQTLLQDATKGMELKSVPTLGFLELLLSDGQVNPHRLCFI